MPKEKEFYRDNLERVLLRWPEGELVRLKEVAEWLRIDVRTLQAQSQKKTNPFPIKKLAGRYYVDKCALARWMS